MLVAALDTATPTLSCALVDLGGTDLELLASRTEPAAVRPGGGSGGHGGRLPAAISELLALCGRRLPEVEGYAVGLGPGSFTGLRIGLATVKGLAYANQRPIAGASSLAAMALAAARDAGRGALLVPLLDARKGEVYAGFYRAAPGGLVEPVRPEAALSPAALLGALSGLDRELEPLGFGEGYLAHAEALGAGLTELGTEVRTPPAVEVARLAADALRGARFDQARLSALEPHYVRASEAEVKFPHGLPPPRP